jgi:hypothetical protein
VRELQPGPGRSIATRPGRPQIKSSTRTGAGVLPEIPASRAPGRLPFWCMGSYSVFCRDAGQDLAHGCPARGTAFSYPADSLSTGR